MELAILVTPGSTSKPGGISQPEYCNPSPSSSLVMHHTNSMEVLFPQETLVPYILPFYAIDYIIRVKGFALERIINTACPF